MIRQSWYLIGLIVALVLVFSPSVAQAQSFSVSPAEVEINNLSPGEETEFSLIIRNKDTVSRTFMLSTHNPKASQRREGRGEFPDSSWISFSPQQIEVAAGSGGAVKAKVAIPASQKWADKDWEIWLGVKPKTSDLLVVNYYIRLSISTGSSVESSSNIGLLAGIAVGVILLTGGIYYFRRKARQICI